jgi:hypothetical protein
MMTAVSSTLAVVEQRYRYVNISTNYKDATMKFIHLCIFSSGIFFLCSCTMFYDKQTAPAPMVQLPKPLAVPVGKNWQVIEEAPNLRDERGRLPFQTEQSLQPEGAKSASPEDNRKIETNR